MNLYRQKNIAMRHVTTVFVAFIFFCLPDSIRATHIVGGQMTYECLGKNMYRITVEMRRDCYEGADDAQFDDPMAIGIYNGMGQLQIQLGLAGQLFIPFNGSDTLNEILTSECRVEGEDVCVHTTTYSAIIMLPSNASGYTLAYQRCCRNQFLANIISPLQTGATWFVDISPTAQNACNSSPKFKNWPSIYLCTNEEIIFDHSATDKDGDSLVYYLCPPTRGATATFPRPQPPPAPPYNLVNYQPGFNALHPMGTETIEIDPHTGLLHVSPIMQSQYLIGVCVDEYRDGVLMSRTRRDFEYNVRICVRDPMADFTVAQDTLCTSLEMSFENLSQGTEITDYLWYFDYPDESKTSTEENPTYTYDTPGSYEVILIAMDGTCQDTARRVIGVSTQNDPLVDFDLEILECEEEIQIQLLDQTTTQQEITGWEWEIAYNGQIMSSSDQNPIFTLPEGQDSLFVQLEVFTVSGCSNVKDSIFMVGIIEVEIELDSTICQGDTVQIDLMVLNPMNEYTYSWEPSELIVDGGNTSMPRFYLPNDGGYTVNYTIVDFYGCSVMGAVNLNARALPEIDLQSELIQCLGDSINLNPNGDPNLIYVWNSINSDVLVNDMSPNPRVSVSDTTAFEVVITTNDEYACSITDTVTVYPPSEIALMILTEPQVICPGFEVELIAFATVDAAFQWFDEDGNLVGEGDTIVVVPDTTTVYTVSGGDEYSCMEDASVLIEVSPDINLMASADTIACYETEVVLTAKADTDVSYEWKNQNGEVLGTGAELVLNVTSDSLISVFATDQNGCVDSANVQVTAYDDINLRVQISSQAICYNQRISLRAFTDVDADIEWYDSTGTELLEEGIFYVIQPTEDITYYVKATDGFGCMDDTYVDINVLPEITFTRTPDTLVCYGEEVTLVAQSDVVPLNYAWLDENSEILGTDSILTLRPTMDRNIQLILINRFGCAVMDTVKIDATEDLALMVDYPAEQSCFGDSITFTASTGSGVSIQWFNAFNELVGTGSELKVSADSTTIYSVVASDEFGCMEDTSFVFQVAPEIRFERTPDTTICMMEEIILSATGSGTLSYSWYNLNGDLLSDADTLLLIPMDTTLIEVVAQDTFGCTLSDTVAVMISPPINLMAEGENFKYCEGESKTITVTTKPGTMIIWYDGDDQIINVGNEYTLTPDGDTPIKIVASDQFGCMQMIDTVLTKYELIIGPLPPVTICEGDQTTITFVNNDPLQTFDYLWTPVESIIGDNMLASVTVQPDDETTYTVFLTNQDGCMFDTTVTVSVSFVDDVEVTAEREEICLGQSTQLFAMGNPEYTYSWTPAEFLDDPASPSPVATPVDEITVFQVVVTNADGCTATDDITIRTEQPVCTEEDIFIPNLFTPNGDGMNDIFMVESNYIDELFLTIYNRWGQKVFETRDIMGGWNGGHEGDLDDPSSVGVYGYYVEVVCIGGLEYQSQGNVTLMR